MASRRKGKQAITPLRVPAYAQVAWLYGRRLRVPGRVDDALTGPVAQAIAQSAEARGLSPANLHGATPAPLGAPTELVVGAILNGAPIVRDAPEMRAQVFAREHRAVSASFSHSGKMMHSRDEDLSVESTWEHELREILDELDTSALRELGAERAPVSVELARDIPLWDGATKLPASGLGWHLVARMPGEGGSLVYGALLPNAGDGYGDDLVETVSLTSAADGVTVRIVGSPILQVDATRPIATLPAMVSAVFEDEVSRRVEALTGKFRSCGYWLLSR